MPISIEDERGKFDFNRANAVHWLILGKPWSVVKDWGSTPMRVKTKDLRFQVIPELDEKSSAAFVDVIGQGENLRVIIAAGDRSYLNYFITAKDPFYQTPPSLDSIAIACLPEASENLVRIQHLEDSLSL